MRDVCSKYCFWGFLDEEQMFSGAMATSHLLSVGPRKMAVPKTSVEPLLLDLVCFYTASILLSAYQAVDDAPPRSLWCDEPYV